MYIVMVMFQLNINRNVYSIFKSYYKSSDFV